MELMIATDSKLYVEADVGPWRSRDSDRSWRRDGDREMDRDRGGWNREQDRGWGRDREQDRERDGGGRPWSRDDRGWGRDSDRDRSGYSRDRDMDRDRDGGECAQFVYVIDALILLVYSSF